MSVILNPAIRNLDTDSLCYRVYIHLYNGFFNAQDKKDDEHPWGIVEGDEVSIRLHNTAFNFAEAISGAAGGSGGGGDGVVLIDYLKKAGGDMFGMLRANYGFEAGYGNSRILETYKTATENEDGSIKETNGIRITGNLDLGANNLLISGKNILSYHPLSDTTIISGECIKLSASSVQSSGNILIGDTKESGVYISPQGLLINNYPVYHAGNANRELIDWTMKDALVSGNLSVKGASEFYGLISGLHGFELGLGGKAALSMDKSGIVVSSFLSFSSGYGIRINDAPVLIRANDTDVQLGGVNGHLLLGSDQTTKIRLLADVFDTDGDYMLISKHGAAYFPDSLRVRHNYGDDLLTSYRTDNLDEGMTIHKKLRFGNQKGGFFYGKSNGIVFSSTIDRDTETGSIQFSYETEFVYQASSSKYQLANEVSNSLLILTSADFITFDKPVESRSHVGIDKSFTRLSDGCLFFTDEQYLLSGKDGVKHYGNSYFLGSLSSEAFSGGFAGSGWAIFQNKTTGNVSATFDELTVRKKMRIYELEVQKTSGTNGSLWVSDSCSGDIVVTLD